MDFNTRALGLVGGIFLALGLWLLLVQPSDPTGVGALGAGRDVVSLHRLTLGETFSIIGAIFIAAAWRPRS